MSYKHKYLIITFWRCCLRTMHCVFVFLQIFFSCCFILTLITLIRDSIMHCILVLFQIWWLCCCIFTLITWKILDSLMYAFLVSLQIIFKSCCVITLITWMPDSVMVCFLVSLQTWWFCECFSTLITKYLENRMVNYLLHLIKIYCWICRLCPWIWSFSRLTWSFFLNKRSLYKKINMNRKNH